MISNVHTPQLNPVHSSVRKKVLLVTLIDPICNYGNILQHYALHEALRSLGYDVDSLNCPVRELSLLHIAKDSIVKNLKNVCKFVLALAGVKKYRDRFRFNRDNRILSKDADLSEQNRKRKALFDEFRSEFLGKMIHSTYKQALARKLPGINDYEYFITGSDQVWNIAIMRTFEGLKVYYLWFAEKDKRVNYAPSFGVSKLKFSERRIHRKGLQGFRKLSVREEEGCRIIKELTGRDAELVLDPTLLMNAAQWRRIARKPNYDLPEHYAAMYILADDFGRQSFKKIASGITHNSITTIDIIDLQKKYCDKTGPREFLWLIDHADYVFTSSFHGTAFSVNFGKKFITFDIGNHAFSRMRSLLSIFGLTDRIYNLNRNILDAPIDYDTVNEKLEAWRKKSMEYLSSCVSE